MTKPLEGDILIYWPFLPIAEYTSAGASGRNIPGNSICD
jgi:hypothetical protein